jgi:peptidoglycan/xylan/chitin deacetylase (PgdA/CDA1 family)
MRTGLKAVLAGAYAAAGGLRRLHAGRLVVLTFHRVRPGGEGPARRAMRTLDVAVPDFRRILEWMSARYLPLAVEDWLAGGARPAQPAFAVTFDDGWADNHEHAFPVLRELGIPATIFLATGAVEERTPFWWQESGLSDAEIEARKAQPGGGGPDLPPPGRSEQRQGNPADYLTWEQVREMGRSGLVRFGAHGHRHALLDRVPRAEALGDVGRCLEILRARIPDLLVPALAWPNGNARDDIGGELEALGLRAAFGTGRGAAGTPDEARWNLPRNNVDRGLSREPGLLPWLLLRAR